MRLLSLVLGLLLCGSPSAISGFIVTVVVDSINAPTYRTFSHVGEEQAEVVAPTITDGDTSSSVVFIPRTFLAIAPDAHVLPNTVCCGSISSALSMLAIQSSDTRHRAFMKTSTTHDSSFPESASNSVLQNKFSVSAVTDAIPPFSVFYRLAEGLNDESSIPISRMHGNAFVCFHASKYSKMPVKKKG